MNTILEPFLQLLSFAFVMWIVGFGCSMMIQCHKGYLKATKVLFLSPFKALWKSHKKLIIGIGIGVILGIWLLDILNQVVR